MDRYKIHPTSKIIQKDVIENPNFTFNNVSILDYPWVSECNLFFPTPHNNQDNNSYFFWRDYYDINEYIEYEDLSDDYMISHWRLYVFDGTTKYNYPSEEVPFPIVSAPDDQTPTDRARMNLEYRRTTCIWALLGCDCNETGIACLKDQNENPELYWTDYGDSDEEDTCDDYCGYHNNEDTKIVVRILGTDMRNTLEYRMNNLGDD